MPINNHHADSLWMRFGLAAVALIAVIGIVALIWRPAKGHITVDTRPTGGAVVLADHFCPAAPCDFEVPPGEYPVQANLRNYQKVETTVDVTPGDPTFKTIHLLPMVPSSEEAQRMHMMRLPDKPGGAVEKANGKN